MKKILFKFASRSRPEKFFGSLDNIIAMIGYPHYKILCSLDFDDFSMNNSDVKRRMGQYKNLQSVFWKSQSKVDAFNRDMDYAGDWDIGILMSDDMVWVKENFGQKIISDFEKLFPNGDGVIHYPDPNAGASVITMSILDRKYYERDGYWYNPIYKSVYCDNEFMEKAIIRGRYAFVNDTLFKHYHYAWGTAEFDSLYMQNEDRMTYITDENTFYIRKQEGFGL